MGLQSRRGHGPRAGPKNNQRGSTGRNPAVASCGRNVDTEHQPTTWDGGREGAQWLPEPRSHCAPTGRAARLEAPPGFCHLTEMGVTRLHLEIGVAVEALSHLHSATNLARCPVSIAARTVPVLAENPIRPITDLDRTCDLFHRWVLIVRRGPFLHAFPSRPVCSPHTLRMVVVMTRRPPAHSAISLICPSRLCPRHHSQQCRILRAPSERITAQALCDGCGGRPAHAS